MNARKAMAATEFVLILPLLTTLLLGCIDFGRFATTQLAVTAAAQNAALVGSTTPCTPATTSDWQAAVVAAAADELAGLPDYDPADLVVTVTLTGGQGGGRVQVSVCYPFRLIVPWPATPPTSTLRDTVALERMRP